MLLKAISVGRNINQPTNKKMGFLEGRIKEEKQFGDVVFPKTLLPIAEAESATHNLVEMIRSERDSLIGMLHRHGAILFRAFHVDTALDFDRVVEAFGWDTLGLATAANRVKITDRVSTANEAPLDQLINFHHETTHFKQPASKIFFFCSQPSPEGGETSIVPSDVVVDKMEERLPELMAKIREVGHVYCTKTPSDDEVNSKPGLYKSWKLILKTDDEVEAERRLKEMTNIDQIIFNSDGSAEFVYGPMNPVRNYGGKRVWFVPILSVTDNINDVKNSFGDGTVFPMEGLLTYREILEENCVDVKWEKGDVLLLDNLTVQHARRPGKPPRVILASVCK